MKWRSSLTFLYFLVGFALMVALTMATLVLLRPLFGDQPSVAVRTIAAFSPLVTGIAFGIRVVWLGKNQGLGLRHAIKNAFRFRSASE